MKFLSLLSALLISHLSFAQVQFTYDNAGNRVKREYNGSLVQLDAKVYLYGATRSGQVNMANDLQIYFTPNTGLLPSTDPYGAGVTYPNIGNPAGLAGALVDWVKVEIRNATNPKVILQSKSLLLKTNGSIVDIDGTIPKFVSQAGPVQLVVKHRNHVAIMSNAIAAFSAGTIPYDFTTALAKAFQLPDYPPQMKDIGGKWALWAGDVNGDYGVDGTDLVMLHSAFNTGVFALYVPADIYMDGSVDGVDMAIGTNAFNIGHFSTLVNYEPY